MNKKIIALALVVMAVPVFATAQSVYKWTDDDGVTHFGDRKPVGKASESVSVRTGSASKASGDSRKSPQQRVDEIEERQASTQEMAEMNAAERARQKQRAANCQTAKSNLALIQTGSRVKVQEDGEKRYLTPQEIEQKRQQFEKIAELNCGKGP
jgi:Domain of unknown function (DUF4124)